MGSTAGYEGGRSAESRVLATLPPGEGEMGLHGAKIRVCLICLSRKPKTPRHRGTGLVRGFDCGGVQRSQITRASAFASADMIRAGPASAKNATKSAKAVRVNRAGLIVPPALVALFPTVFGLRRTIALRF